MVCDVPVDRRADFAAAQRQWAPIACATGLVGQVGGWNQHGQACVLAMWADGASYERFFAHVHDAITEFNDQARTFTHLSVTLAQGLLILPGEAVGIGAALRTTGLLRVADCRVRGGRVPHFVRAQMRVWAPGMAGCSGMLGGRFSAVEADEGRYLVTTLWADEASHEAYREGPFRALRQRAQASDDLDEVVGHRVIVDPRWRVVPVEGGATLG